MSKRVYNHEIAEEFFTSDEYANNIAYSEKYEEFYVWKNGYYEQVSKRGFRKMVWDFIRVRYPAQNITKSLIDDVIFQITLGCLRIFEEEDSRYIAFKDVLLDTQTFQPVKLDKEKFVMFSLPYHYHDLDDNIYEFKKFLETSLVKKDETTPDQELIKLVQEMMGNFLIPNMNASAAFFLVGFGSNGKSVLSELIGDIFGEKFRIAMSLQTLTTRQFSLFHLIGKRINISNEEESKYMQSDVFKALVTGEMMSGEKKFGGHFEFNNTAKMLFASNRLPVFDGLNYGLRRRIKIVPFLRIFSDKEQDVNLAKKLRKEIPGILLWMIEGAKRLKENNYTFTNPEVSSSALEDLVNEMSSAMNFVSEDYIVTDTPQITKNDLYNDYTFWCRENGRKAMSKINFIKDIESNIPNIKEGRIVSDDGSKRRGLNLYKKSEEYKEVVESFEEDDTKEIDVNKLEI